MAGQGLTQLIGVVAVVGWSAVATVVLVLVTKALVGLRSTDQEIDDAAVLMAKMSGAEPDGSALRRNRKLVAKLLAQPSLAARERR